MERDNNVIASMQNQNWTCDVFETFYRLKSFLKRFQDVYSNERVGKQAMANRVKKLDGSQQHL